MWACLPAWAGPPTLQGWPLQSPKLSLLSLPSPLPGQGFSDPPGPRLLTAHRRPSASSVFQLRSPHNVTPPVTRTHSVLSLLTVTTRQSHPCVNRPALPEPPCTMLSQLRGGEDTRHPTSVWEATWIAEAPVTQRAAKFFGTRTLCFCPGTYR